MITDKSRSCISLVMWIGLEINSKFPAGPRGDVNKVNNSIDAHTLQNCNIIV